MKQLLISFLSLVIVLTTPTFGQVDSVTDQYMGNGNLLVNPGLESGLKSWTNVAGVLSVESSVVIKGKRAGKVVLSSQALNLYQDVTSYQAQLADGVQGLASIRVKTSINGVRVCPRQAGVINSNLCVNVLANGKWGLYKVPFSLGATSNGISINSNGTSVSGSVYVDDAFMGPQELSLETNACNDTSCETNFTASINASDVVSGENLDWIVGDCTDANVGRQTCTFKTGLFTVTPNCVATAGPIGGSYQYANIYSVSSTSVTIEIRRTDSNIPINNQSIISCSKQGADFIAAKNLSNGNTYSSTNADTDWTPYSLSIQATTTAPTKGGVQIDSAKWRRKGSHIEIRYQYYQTSAGAAGSGTYLFPFPNIPQCGGQCEVDTTKLIPFKINTGETPVGYGLSSSGAASGKLHPVLTTTLLSATWGNKSFALTYARQGLEDQAPIGSSFYSLSTAALTYDVFVTFPVKGWSDSNLIIAQLSGLEKCENTLECTDTFSARISSAGVVSDENLDWISGNASSAVSGASQRYTINFKSGIFTVGPNCSVTILDDSIVSSAQATCNMPSITNSGLITSCGRQDGSSEAATPTSHLIICQKQGVDYVGKTAKAVANDQSVRSIGAINVDIQSVMFGSGANCAAACTTGNCTICKQVGSKITSVSFASTGQYNVNGIDGTKYNCSGNGSEPGVTYTILYQDPTANTSSYARIQNAKPSTGTTVNGGGMNLTCIGVP